MDGPLCNPAPLAFFGVSLARARSLSLSLPRYRLARTLSRCPSWRALSPFWRALAPAALSLYLLLILCRLFAHHNVHWDAQMLDSVDDRLRHNALHVMFASDVDKVFLATKLTLIKSKDPSTENRSIATRMLRDMLE